MTTKKRNKKFHAQGIAKYCAMSKQELMSECDYYTVNDAGSYLGFKSNNGNVLAVAHVDYHCSGKVHEQTKRKVVSSALDDRAGCYIALNMLEEYGVNADVLLTDDEEIGLSTIDQLGQGNLYKYNWIVQLDRRGTGAVLYGFTEMQPFVSKHFTVHSGSYSDICELEEVSPVSAFNMGVGYYNEHSEKCHLVMSDLFAQMQRLEKFYKEFGDTHITRDHFPIEMNERAYSRRNSGYRLVKDTGNYGYAESNITDQELEGYERIGYSFYVEDDYYIDPQGNVCSMDGKSPEKIVWEMGDELFDDPDGLLTNPQDRWEV